MRKLLRQMAKEYLRRSGAAHANKVIGNGRWRQFVGAYPVDTVTGERMQKNYHGRKKYRRGTYNNHLFFYDRLIANNYTKKRLKKA